MKEYWIGILKTVINSEYNEMLHLLKNDGFARIGAVYVFLVCLLFSFISLPIILLLLASYIAGLLVCSLVIRCKKSTPAYLNQLANFCKSHSPIPKKPTHSCSICDDLSCKRHQQDSNLFPWENIIISKELNTAVEKFYGRILDNFVNSWYDSLSKNENFSNELKFALRYSTSAILKRILEIDLTNLISKKLFPCAVKHIDDHIYIEQITKLKNSRFHDVAVEYLGNRLHGAATNRSNELIYLKELTASVLPFVLPKKYHNCRNFNVLFQEIIAGWVLLPLMDVLSDPNIINSLIIMAANHKSKNVKHRESSEKVQLLENFGCVKNQWKSLFYRDLNDIIENTELLYTFMQFLKKEEHVRLLQFCLNVDEFNNKLMAPDLSKTTLDELYGEAITLHSEYIAKDSPNYVKCSEKISVQLKELLKDGVHSIAKIKVSGPLIQAYKEVFDNLEENWLPAFFQSNEFYNYLCGSKITSQYTKSSKTKIKKNLSLPSASSSKLSGLEKLRSALKNATPVEGSIYTPEIQSIEDGNTMGIPVCYSLFRDISAWEINISSYVSLNKVIYFHLNVKRPYAGNNEKDAQRVVLRKDQDFYTLKAKLVEFHGENEIYDSPLPARKAGSDISTRMAGYERFLRKLLQNDNLKGSDLLHTFLTIEEDFSIYISTCGAPFQDFGNIYQSVAQKLRKEKGQHLDSFMNVFMASIGNNKTSKFTAPEIGDEVDTLNTLPQYTQPPKTYRNHVFNDNFGVSYNKSRKSSSMTVNPTNFTECLFYLGKHFFHIPHLIMRSYVAISTIAADMMESIWNILIQRGLSTGLSQQRLESLVTFLEETIFEDESDPPTKLELENRKKEALKILNGLQGKFPYKFLGENFLKGLIHLWEISQHPQFNKQLTYQLLDIVLLELYPSIIEPKK